MMSKHRKNSIAHDAVYGKEAVVDWLARGDETTLKYFQQWREISDALASQGKATMPNDLSIRNVVDQIGYAVAFSETWYVTEDIAALIMDSSLDMPPHSVRHEDLPCESGWLYFEQPLEVLATDGTITKVRAMLWQHRSVGDARRGQSEGPGILTWFFSDLDDFTDPADWRDRDPQGDYASHVHTMFAGRTPMVPVTFGVTRDQRIPWVTNILRDDSDDIVAKDLGWVASNPWVENAFQRFYKQQSWSDTDRPMIHGDIEKDGTDDGRWIIRTPNGQRVLLHPDPGDRWLLAFFRWIQQKLPSITHEDLPKSGQKRMRNKGMPYGPITVVSWRRREHGEGAVGTGRTLTYRHVRRGHWRRQWRGPKDAQYMVPIYINPTIVGSPELPLRIREVTNAVVR